MAKARPITEAEFKRAFALAGTSRYPERNQAILALSARAGMPLPDAPRKLLVKARRITATCAQRGEANRGPLEMIGFFYTAQGQVLA